MEKLNQKIGRGVFLYRRGGNSYPPPPPLLVHAPGEISETEKQEDNQNETVLVTKLFVLRDRTKM